MDSDDGLPLAVLRKQDSDDGLPLAVLRKRDSDDGLPLAVLRKRDSDDGLPLAVLRNRKEFNSLRRRRKPIPCNFCDKQFKTRFAIFKHNAKHIIIPLIKLKLFQCDDCLFYFTTHEELQGHINKKHATRILDLESLTKKGLASYQEILKSIVEKQVIVKCHDILSDVFKTSMNIPIRKPSITESNKSRDTVKIEHIPTFIISSDSEDVSPEREDIRLSNGDRVHTPDRVRNTPERVRKTADKVKNTTERVTNTPERVQNNSFKETTRENDSGEQDRSSPSLKELSTSLKDNSSPNYEPLSSRIMFEDVDDDLFQVEEILPDLPSQYSNQKIILGSKINGAMANSFILGSQLSDNGDEEYTESVHYDELIREEVCECRYCGRVFFNRFELIKHELTHIRLRRARPSLCAVCECYIGGTRALQKHILTKHPQSTKTKFPLHNCFNCNLRYHNLKKHKQYYHQIQCKNCNRRYEKDQVKNHKCSVTPSSLDIRKVLKLCEICLSFVRNKQNMHYEVLREFSEVGIRQRCDQCQCMFFEVILVERKITYKEGDLLRKKRPPSNQDRLKKMQKRLKMANKMIKCCFLVLFVLNDLLNCKSEHLTLKGDS